ncbi:NVEALA domain-containing protein [Bacteroides helcogenes]|uniref:NVEALA protein n=1 Tax=Bacteroides helcogenes (strain ATCC 35417 / DSM 20613 / JCM 6297 / CCUG 15421 / P 36-108) TaxID=693979 RepID=E6SN66_BACT6|nr:NVEALA domain-containing protein [Bacteroides helcogenes]ADV44719.1 hypothetical protein Bache_2776 [Bacteroides helcogenes P 36-108]MDY5238520.1 NVEALA domain-containing protein [Bacteroides helcogenes]
MKKKITICITLAVITALVAYQKLEKKAVLSDIVLQNIEALAQYENSSDCAEWAIKNCYEVFSLEYGDNYYASCAPTTMGGIAECGAIEAHKPAGMSKVNSCLQCIREH